ncbi:hypothetical protein [Qingshengfaniella alkalisoli]|uniref:hypothetical protein n=1 Tax=Qingshengfaniella alkalisoli TaxID=2599296 RepID=UPI00143DB851|nr:hypothetical protein [Qingshengfaniella alkalisoli]
MEFIIGLLGGVVGAYLFQKFQKKPQESLTEKDVHLIDTIGAEMDSILRRVKALEDRL